jgi:hypothetical protein
MDKASLAELREEAEKLGVPWEDLKGKKIDNQI